MAVDGSRVLWLSSSARLFIWLYRTLAPLCPAAIRVILRVLYTVFQFCAHAKESKPMTVICFVTLGCPVFSVLNITRCLSEQEVRVQSCLQPHHTSALTVLKDPPSMQISNQNSSKSTKEPDFQPIRIQHEEGKVSGSRTSDSKSTANQQAPPSRAGPITLPVRPLEKCNTGLPTSLKEILEMPSTDLAVGDVSKKHPLLRLLLNAPNSGNVPPEQAGYRGSPVEVGLSEGTAVSTFTASTRFIPLWCSFSFQ